MKKYIYLANLIFFISVYAFMGVYISQSKQLWITLLFLLILVSWGFSCTHELVIKKAQKELYQKTMMDINCKIFILFIICIVMLFMGTPYTIYLLGIVVLISIHTLVNINPVLKTISNELSFSYVFKHPKERSEIEQRNSELRTQLLKPILVLIIFSNGELWLRGIACLVIGWWVIKILLKHFQYFTVICLVKPNQINLSTVWLSSCLVGIFSFYLLGFDNPFIIFLIYFGVIPFE